MRAKKTDANQPRIVEQLRALHVSVQILSGVGDDCPDLLLGFRGKNFLVEIKDPSRKPCERKLRPGQKRFFDSWRGQVAKCETLEEILVVIGLSPAPDPGPRMVDTVKVDNSEPNY